MRLLACGLFLSLALAAGVLDLRTRRIPNWLTVAGALTGLGLAASVGAERTIQSAMGLGAALLVGLTLFQLRALGAGDAKLLAAFGAWFGLRGLPAAFLAMTAGGAILALLWALRHGVLRGTLASTGAMLGGALQEGRRVRPWVGDTPVGKFPYGLGLGAGAAVWWLWTGCGGIP